ncbi:Ig-like domain-containing protein [Proteus mirabilis]|uniref:Ig-like domain-containing protein n=1 Tax=Proteus mirabilis TaxID=584 RepID=UPI0023495264|nr:Ig-like domain-containing protein [Proteus mirabilis]MDC5946705.1 Ig-like domain-containing protein [Proteus mirabilis]MDC5976944.1 Ig-like domain-containing protein [Proteus mirabilis]MDC5982157.1 Ig-like domain-containing protein [Proteus mirabilis]
MNIIFFEKNSNEKVQLQPHAKHTITAKAGDVYQLIDSDTQLSPLDIQAHRKSDDLILSSKEQNIEVVIKDFWQECQPGEQQCYATLNVLDSNGVMGQATITQDGPVLEHLVAGETGTLSDNDDGIGLFLWVAGSIGSALAIFLANRNHGGDNNKGNEADITAPSKPGLTAEDDGSVSIDLPKDANKGDSVDVTFEDEDGNSNTVTLEKEDNGWTSSDPELIPDTDNNQVTIPNDKIKDNSDVTASAKDPSGNKSDDVTVTAKPDPVSDMPVLSIPEVDDGYANAEELKDGLQAEVTLPAGTVEGAEITLTVTRPDNTTETITYTVTKDDVAAGKISIDIPKDAVQNGQNSVDVSLTQGNNPAKPGNKVDFAVDGQIPGDTDGDGTVDTTPVVTIPEATDGVNADELKDGVQTEVTVPGGSAAGDTLTLTITKPDGSTDTVEHTLTADEVAAGKTDVTIPADKVTADGNYSVTAEITDPAGNTSGQGKPTDFMVDTQIPGDTDGDGTVDTTPVVTIPEATDGVNADELKDGVQTEVTVPGGSAEGDKLTLTITKPDGSTDTVEHTLTADEVAAGKADVTIPADKVTADGNYSVTAEITDPAGNTSGQGKPTDFMVDTQIPGDTDGDGTVDTALVVTIPEATDGVNADELKDGVQTEVTVPGGSAEGDKLTLTITKPDGSTDTVEHTLTADEVTAGKADVTIPADKVTADGNYSVTAEITDPAGNTSGQGKPTDFAVDTVAPSAPVLKAEDDGSVSADLPTDANKGDTVEITFEDEKGDKHTVTLEKGDNGWTSDTPALIPDSNGDKATIPADNVKDNSEVTGIAKDLSGNESDPSTVTSKTDGVADAPVLTIPEVADGYANADELKDGLQAEVTLPAGTVEGAEITLTVTRPDKTTETVTHTVTKDEAAAGKVSVDIPKDAVQNGQNSVDVSLTQGNNPAKPGNKVDFAVDGQIPGDTDGDGTVDTTPVVTIPEATDGVNADELKDGVQTEVTVPGGSAAGDTLTLTITKPDGSTDTVEHTLTADEVAAGKTDVTIPADKVTADGNYSVTAEITDPAGNTSGQGKPTDFMVDTQIPGDTDGDGTVDTTPVVTIPEATDGVNADELKDGVQTEVTVPGGSAEGDKLTLTITKPDGSTDTVEHTLTADEVAAGKADVTIPADKVTADGNYSVTAEITDPAGNTSGQGKPTDFMVDTQIPGDTDGDGTVDTALVVTIPEATDGVNADELKDGVQTEVTVPGGSAEGDKLTLTITKPDGSTDTVEHTLTADEVTAGKADVTIPADKVTADGNYSVTAEITDPAGNTSGQGKPTDFAVDTVAPSAPVLKAEDDGSVSADLPTDANKGDTVEITFEDEKGDKHTVTLEKGDNGWTSDTPALIPDSNGDKATIPADNVKDNSEVTGIAKDLSGNESDPSTVTSKTDGVADAPVLTIPEVADGYANADELKDGLQAEVTLPAGTVEGAEITLTVTRPDKTTETVTHTVTKDEAAAGKVSVDIPKDAVQNGQNSVDVSLTQGNNPAKPGNKVDFAVDGQIPGDTDGDGTVDTTPAVTIPEATDGVNADELKDGVQTEVTVPGGSAAGDTLTLTITKPDGSTDTVEHTLTADEVTAGKADVTIPADKVTADGNYSVTAEITDPAGNTSGQGKPTDFMVDTQIPGDTDGDGVVDTTPVVTIPEATDGVNADELKDGVQTQVTVPGGSAAGDTLTLTIAKPDGSTDTVEHTLTADEVTAGKADVTIPADKATPDGNYSVKAEITDPAGNTSGEGKATDFTVDTVAPSAPVLNAEDNGSVSVELPGDANKGDTVEITFEDEKGDKQTVTMEKGDNGWTSSDPNLIPDSQGNNTAIPSDNVKDNSEVTAIAKDPSGNESAPATATSKTDVLPTVSISVDTTSVNDNGDKISADASVSGEITEVPATIEDKDDTTGLVYTVALDYVAAQDVTVTITLTNDAGHASAPDYSTLAGSQHDGKIALHGDTGKVTYDGASTVTVVIPAGSKSVSFIVDPTMEANQNAFNAEGMEKVVATITGTSNNATAVTDTVNNAGASATGVIYDGNPISLRNLDGDFTLKYSLSSSVAENGDFGYTIGVDSGKKDPKLTTDYNDTIYVGYYQDGSETSSYSNLANSQDNGPDGTKTDGNQSITTVDLGAGDDLMVIRGNMLTNTRVYAGEGNDTFTMDGMNTALRSMYAGSYLFMESGNDTVTIKRTGVTNAGQIYLGSGSDTFTQGDANDQNNTELSGLLDLGSGTQDKSNMPNEYLSVYQDGSNLSLGNDNNIDAVTDVNTVTIYGSVSGEILGGYGSDNITITKNLTGNVSVGDNTDTLTAGWIYGGATVSMGDGNDTVTVTEGAYNTTISLGAGDDVFDATAGVMGDSVSATLVNGEDGNDTIKLGTIGKNLTVDAGAGDDTVILTKDYDPSPIGNQGYINGGEGTDTLVLSGTITVNMATKTDEGIANFEKVDMTVNSELKVDNSSQTIKLTASDVLGMNANSTIYISGDANDKVDLGADGAGGLGTFTATATTTKATALDGTEHTYTLYSSASGANVYIDNNIIDNGGVI